MQAVRLISLLLYLVHFLDRLHRKRNHGHYSKLPLDSFDHNKLLCCILDTCRRQFAHIRYWNTFGLMKILVQHCQMKSSWKFGSNFGFGPVWAFGTRFGKLTSYRVIYGLGRDFREELNLVPYGVSNLGQLSSGASIHIHSDVLLMLDLLSLHLVHLWLHFRSVVLDWLHGRSPMMTSYNLSVSIEIESYRILFVVQNAFPIESFLLARLIHFEEPPCVQYILIFDFIGINLQLLRDSCYVIIYDSFLGNFYKNRNGSYDKKWSNMKIN